MKNKKYNNIGTAPKSNRQFIETKTKSIPPNTQVMLSVN
jgi:hypothetical protein